MKVEKLTPNIGAIIRNINLNEKISSEVIEQLKETFYTRY